MFPKLLSEDQKGRRKKLSLELLQRIENEPDLLNSIITCDEIGYLHMIRKPSGNQCSGNQHHLQDHPHPPKKTVVSISMFKDMLIVFFDIQRIVSTGWVTSSLPVNQQYYIEVLTK